MTTEYTRDERIVSTEPASLALADIVKLPAGADLANVGVPTQVANPSRASWRTFAQSCAAFLVVANAAAVVIVSFLGTPDGQAILELLPPQFVAGLFAVLNAAVLIGSGVAKLAALLMANPTVNRWIVEHLSFLAPIKP